MFDLTSARLCVAHGPRLSCSRGEGALRRNAARTFAGAKSRLRLLALLTAPPLLALFAPAAWAANDLIVTPAQIKQLDITFADVRLATKSIVTTLPATIVAPMNTRIAVTAPFSGTVLQVLVLPGQSVRQGEPLVTLASRDLAEVAVRLKQAEADLQVAEVVALRQRDLFKLNLVAAGRVGETEAQVEKIRALVRESQRTMKLGNIKLDPDGGYALTAPRDGRVVEIKATPGAALQAMEAPVVIDTSRELWLQAQLPAHMVGKAAVGDAIELPNGDAGKVISVGIALDPMTRSTSLLAEIPASPERISGQTTTITIVKPVVPNEFEIPAAAISWIGGKPYVFLQTPTGFRPAPIGIKGQTANVATVAADLRPGDKLAVNGLAQLEKIMTGE
jgi:cobalt-zinc-cadmium efflux system membrane fusion protein